MHKKYKKTGKTYSPLTFRCLNYNPAIYVQYFEIFHFISTIILYKIIMMRHNEWCLAEARHILA